MIKYANDDVRLIKAELMLPGRPRAGEVPPQGRIVIRTGNFNSRMQATYIEVPSGENVLHIELVGEPATELLMVLRRADGTLYSQTRSVQSQFSFPVNPERELQLGDPEPPTNVDPALRDAIVVTESRNFQTAARELSESMGDENYRIDGGIGGMEVIEPVGAPEAR
ncbi:MAG: hypothetical protein AAF202_06760 [Pseudomonadota bacterium]